MKIRTLMVLSLVALLCSFSITYLARIGGASTDEGQGGAIQVIEGVKTTEPERTPTEKQTSQNQNPIIPVKPPDPEIKMLAAGTPSETPLYIIRGASPGPSMLVLGGVHGDEPSAYWSGNMAARLRIQAGTLYVIPHLNVIAMNKGTRAGLGDINRKFSGSPDGDSESRLCYEVSTLIRNNAIRYVMTFHEALDYKKVSANPGQTLYYDWDINPYAGTNLRQEADSIIARANEKIRLLQGFKEVELFESYIEPIPGSATFELMKDCGVQYAFGCEVAKKSPEARRVWFHLTLLVTWMEMKGLTVTNWSEVESQIWSGDFKKLI